MKVTYCSFELSSVAGATPKFSNSDVEAPWAFKLDVSWQGDESHGVC